MGEQQKIHECNESGTTFTIFVRVVRRSIRTYQWRVERDQHPAVIMATRAHKEKKKAMTLAVTSNQAATEERRYWPAESTNRSRVAYFEYFGGSTRIVTGVSGLTYYFVGQRSLVAVDARDRRALARIPGLRKVT